MAPSACRRTPPAALPPLAQSASATHDVRSVFDAAAAPTRVRGRGITPRPRGPAGRVAGVALAPAQPESFAHGPSRAEKKARAADRTAAGRASKASRAETF